MSPSDNYKKRRTKEQKIQTKWVNTPKIKQNSSHMEEKDEK